MTFKEFARLIIQEKYRYLNETGKKYLLHIYLDVKTFREMCYSITDDYYEEKRDLDKKNMIWGVPIFEVISDSPHFVIHNTGKLLNETENAKETENAGTNQRSQNHEDPIKAR